MKILLALLCIFILIVVSCYWYFPTDYYHGPISDHFNGKHFYNPSMLGKPTHKSTLDLLKWQWSRHRSEWPSHVLNEPHPPLPVVTNPNEVQATFINHSTVLLQTKEVNFLTDPIWAERASPFTFWGPKRVRNPGLEWSELPRIDVVLISHNHYDHMNLETLVRLKNQFDPLFIVPLGNASILKYKGITKIVELDWWQTYHFKNAIITLLPTLHWSARWLNDKFRALWGSYGIDVAHQKIYFAGDTGYSDLFSQIHARWGAPTLTFLPIGSYEPRWFMKNNHLNPEEAILAFKDLQAKKAIAIHYGTFQLSDEAYTQPESDLKLGLKKAGINENDFIILKEGHSIKGI